MTIVKEVADAIELAAKAIEGTHKIVVALHDARSYLRQRYPGSEAALQGLLQEIRSTLLGLARVSDVVTDFRFTVAGAAQDFEPVRFNTMVIDRKSRLAEMSVAIEKLKGSSAKTRDYAEALASRGGRKYWELFDFLGRGAAHEQQLSAQFNDLWVIDGRIVAFLEQLLAAARTALDEVQRALGASGTADPANVPFAAQVLGEYADAFRPIETQCTELAEQLQKDSASLSDDRLVN
jgi:hypothetical protein